LNLITAAQQAVTEISIHHSIQSDICSSKLPSRLFLQQATTTMASVAAGGRSRQACVAVFMYTPAKLAKSRADQTCNLPRRSTGDRKESSLRSTVSKEGKTYSTSLESSHPAVRPAISPPSTSAPPLPLPLPAMVNRNIAMLPSDNSIPHLS